MIRAIAPPLSPAGDPGGSLALRTLRRVEAGATLEESPTLEIWRMAASRPRTHLTASQFHLCPSCFPDSGGGMVLEQPILCLW